MVLCRSDVRLHLGLTVMKHLFLSLLAVVGLSAPASAQKTLPPGEIRANGDITFGNALKLGRREGSATVITPDTLQILGPGSTGDIRAMASPGAGTAVRTLMDRFAERPSVIDYGVDMTGVADSTAAFTSALNSGRPITAPCGTIRLLSTVTVAVRSDFRAAGACTILKYDAAGGTSSRPVLDIKKTAGGSRFEGFAFDHQADKRAFADPLVYGGNLIAGSAVLIQADDVAMSNVTGRNGHDNCIAVVQLPDVGPPWQAIAGQPKRVSLKTIRTASCGQNRHKAGAGIDVASGSLTVVDDLVDIGSSGAFILDIGAGAQGSFSNMTGFATSFDAALFAQNGTRSQTFYIGSADSTFTNLVSIDAGDRALWLDGFANGTLMNNVYLKTPANEAAYIKTPKATINGLTINSPGYGKPTGTVDAVAIDPSSAPITNLNFLGFTVQEQFNKARYAINRVGSSGLIGSVVGSDLSGAMARTNNLPGSFGVVDGLSLGGAWTPYTPTVVCDAGGTLGSTSSSGAYRRVGQTVDFRANTTIKDRGTCKSGVRLGLPFQSADSIAITGVESALSGALLAGHVAPGFQNGLFKKADGSSPAFNGAVLTIGGTYQWH